MICEEVRHGETHVRTGDVIDFLLLNCITPAHGLERRDACPFLVAAALLPALSRSDVHV